MELRVERARKTVCDRLWCKLRLGYNLKAVIDSIEWLRRGHADVAETVASVRKVICRHYRMSRKAIKTCWGPMSMWVVEMAVQYRTEINEAWKICCKKDVLVHIKLCFVLLGKLHPEDAVGRLQCALRALYESERYRPWPV